MYLHLDMKWELVTFNVAKLVLPPMKPNAGTPTNMDIGDMALTPLPTFGAGDHLATPMCSRVSASEKHITEAIGKWKNVWLTLVFHYPTNHANNLLPLWLVTYISCKGASMLWIWTYSGFLHAQCALTQNKILFWMIQVSLAPFLIDIYCVNEKLNLSEEIVIGVPLLIKILEIQWT